MPEQTFSLPTITAKDALSTARSGALEVVDMRKPEAVRTSGVRLAGALARDPYKFGHDDPLTQSPRQVAVFCVHGHEVSHFACALLRVHGVDAFLVEGGIEALRIAGAETVAAEQDH